jgi:penicillin amidase
MVTSTTAPLQKRSTAWRKTLIFLVVVPALVVLALLGLGLWFHHAAERSLAQLDGSIRLAGLHAPVQVTRDTHGVPHLSAGSLEDLFFAQGFVTAQDRLWQMDVTRRAMAGEMAEIFPAQGAPAGPATRINGTPPANATWVDYDKQQRILRLRAVAERVAEQLQAPEAGFFAAYARGVNAYIEQHKENLPIEFRVLGYSPRAWRPADSVLIGVGMSQLLNPQYEMEYKREKIAQLLSPELMADLYPPDSPRDHAPASDGGSIGKWALQKKSSSLPRLRQPSDIRALSVPTEARVLQQGEASSTLTLPELNLIPVLSVFGEQGECESCVPGSNDWVVSGAHTTSGKPLLSNDMHLPHRVPGVWYEVHLHSGDYNVEGFTLPGMPFVIVGHNQRIAWGYTNLNPDVQDLFIENFNSKGDYETPQGWKQPEKFHEVIHVKGKQDEQFDVTVTRHGPIINELLPGETRQIALQWLIYDTRAIDIPLFRLNSAQNWEQFRQALSTFATPSQNVVYGDVDGNIGYQPMGFVPVRASGDGTIPVSGADGKHDWTGYLDFDKLPAVYNPPGGIIATANARITPNGYPYLLATQWFPPYRTERIYQVLQSGKKFSPADMLQLQTDVMSNYDRLFAQEFAAGIELSGKAGERAKQAASILKQWDGRIEKEAVAPTIVAGARRALWELILRAKLGDHWKQYEWSEQSVALENIITNKPARWLPPEFTNFNDLLTAAVEKGLKNAPANLNSWHYGEQYPVVINHPLLSAIPGMKGVAAPGTNPQAGGGMTVKQVGRGFGPSERMTVDFSNLDGSTFNLVQGESGQIFSPYYMDHWDAWYNNKTFTLSFSDAAVERTKAHALTLEPK